MLEVITIKDIYSSITIQGWNEEGSQFRGIEKWGTVTLHYFSDKVYRYKAVECTCLLHSGNLNSFRYYDSKIWYDIIRNVKISYTALQSRLILYHHCSDLLACPLSVRFPRYLMPRDSSATCYTLICEKVFIPVIYSTLIDLQVSTCM